MRKERRFLQAAAANFPWIRLAAVATDSAPTALRDTNLPLALEWQPASAAALEHRKSPAAAPDWAYFSAICWFTAREVALELGACETNAVFLLYQLPCMNIPSEPVLANLYLFETNLNAQQRPAAVLSAGPSVPLGLIESDVGGTPIESWTPGKYCELHNN